MQMMLKCEFWKEKKFIFVNWVMEFYSRPIRQNKEKYDYSEVLL